MKKATARTLMVTAALIIVLGSVAAQLANLPPFPSAAVLVALTSVFAALWFAHDKQIEEQALRQRSARLHVTSLVSCLVITGGIVLLTGGVSSPFSGLLLLPVFLGAWSFGFAGSVVVGTVVAGLFLLCEAVGPRVIGASQANAPLLQAIIFEVVALAMGGFVYGMCRTIDDSAKRARDHEERARRHEEQAARNEAVLDTAVMMDSLDDLENILSVALIRLTELVPCDVAAVYLRDSDGQRLELAQASGLSGSAVPVRSLSVSDVDVPRDETGYWPDTERLPGGELGPLAHLDPAARSVIVAPLRTPFQSFGLIYLNSRTPGGLSDLDRDIVNQFARHVLFPIQRVRIKALAATDVMTGLFNHHTFRERLVNEVERARRYGHLVSLIMIDIDHFKSANDTYGHPAGDALLAQTAAILRSSMRATDIVARYGGEEMAIICPETGADDACALAERIRTSVERNAFALPNASNEARLSVSLGVATLPTHAHSDQTLIDAADRALFEAKANGRNRVRVAATTPSPPVIALAA